MSHYLYQQSHGQTTGEDERVYLGLNNNPVCLQNSTTTLTPCDFPALAIFDVFNGQVTPAIFSMLNDNNILVVRSPQIVLSQRTLV